MISFAYFAHDARCKMKDATRKPMVALISIVGVCRGSLNSDSGWRPYDERKPSVLPAGTMAGGEFHGTAPDG